ncbi:MAG TPA: LysM domain-containing protein [Anaerolineales bacterium]|nr:LysM domain-containing protein [Anaerolineales bacterium]
MFEQFPITSRYYRLETATLVMPDGKTVTYLRRRFLPPAKNFSLLKEHTVVEGERLDHIAAQNLGDPEQFWRLCDANNAMRPEDLLEIGKKLRITLPEGIPGPGND